MLAPNCRFGITTPTNTNNIDITPFRIGALLNWAVVDDLSLPPGVDFINVLRLGDRCFDSSGDRVTCSSLPDPRPPYQITLDTYQANVAAHPGMYWSIGNEPDTSRSTQDSLTAEEYANRYYTLATNIRLIDPTAKLGFGAVVGMTPIRMRYLDKAWTQLVSLAGSPEAASALIDFWAPHAFVLNEIPGEWGSGVPPGFANDHSDATSIRNYSDTYNITKFSARVRNFRTWMKTKGEQDKPLWITEYGSLFPPIDAPGQNYVNVSDAATSAFMLKTFDFLLNTTDASTGLPKDHYKLVQRWFWYSLNDFRYRYGGSLFDPSKTPPQITSVGRAFLNYAPKDDVRPEFHFYGDIGLRPDLAQTANFLVDFTLINSGSSIGQSARVWAYQDSLDNPPYVQVDAPVSVMGCGEAASETLSIPYPPLPTSANKLYLRLDTNGNQSLDASDETVSLTPPPFPGPLTAAARSYSRASLSWLPARGQDGYLVQRSDDGGTTWAEIATVGTDASTYTDAGLACSSAHQYRIQAFDSRGNWGFSNPGSLTTDTCAVLSTGAESLSQVRINLSWSNPYNTPTGIRIERSPDGSSGWSEVGTAPGNSTAYSDRSLLCAQTYFYRVRAASDFEGVVDYWEYSNVTSATTAACALPPIPLALAVHSRTSTSIQLTWTDQENEYEYRIERSPDGVNDWAPLDSLTRDLESYVDGNLPPGSAYSYRLRAWNSTGLSDYSQVKSGQSFLYDYLLPFLWKK